MLITLVKAKTLHRATTGPGFGVKTFPALKKSGKIVISPKVRAKLGILLYTSTNINYLHHFDEINESIRENV